MQALAQKQNATRQQASFSPARPVARAAEQRRSEIEDLQRTIGNQAVLRLLRAHATGSAAQPGAAGTTTFASALRPNLSAASMPSTLLRSAPRLTLQAKLTVNTPGDVYEQEADRIADQVIRMPEPVAATPPISPGSGSGEHLQRSCACGGTCADCTAHGEEQLQQHVQRKEAPAIRWHSGHAAPGGAFEAPASVYEVLRSPGEPLDAATRTFMEPRFGRDFTGVRVHAGTNAARSALQVRAQAYTVGQHIVLDREAHAPGSTAGRQLLAHELTHVVQQSNQPAVFPTPAAGRGISATSIGSPRVQRQGRHFAPGTREVTIEVPWKADPDKFYFRLMDAILASKAFRGALPEDFTYASSRETPLQIMAYKFHENYEMNHAGIKNGERIKLQFSAAYDPDKETFISKRLAVIVKPAPEPPPQPAPSPEHKDPEPAKPPCAPLPKATGGKKCKFYVYDSTLSGLLGMAWKRGAIADAKLRSATYAIPSGESMEEMLYNVLYQFAELDCACTDEIQFWGHGSRGNGAWISGSSKGATTQIETSSFDIPDIEKFGDNPKMPGYQEWESKLSTFQRRLMILRRTICDSDSTIYYRSCQAFQGEEGKKFAKASSDFWRCEVAGHTKNIGLSQPGKHVLPVCQDPDWPDEEGAEARAKKDKQKLLETKPR